MFDEAHVLADHRLARDLGLCRQGDEHIRIQAEGEFVSVDWSTPPWTLEKIADAPVLVIQAEPMVILVTAQPLLIVVTAHLWPDTSPGFRSPAPPASGSEAAVRTPLVICALRCL